MIRNLIHRTRETLYPHIQTVSRMHQITRQGYSFTNLNSNNLITFCHHFPPSGVGSSEYSSSKRCRSFQNLTRYTIDHPIPTDQTRHQSQQSGYSRSQGVQTHDTRLSRPHHHLQRRPVEKRPFQTSHRRLQQNWWQK